MSLAAGYVIIGLLQTWLNVLRLMSIDYQPGIKWLLINSLLQNASERVAANSPLLNNYHRTAWIIEFDCRWLINSVYSVYTVDIVDTLIISTIDWTQMDYGNVHKNIFINFSAPNTNFRYE